MSMFRKLSQPLLFWPYRFYKGRNSVLRFFKTRKVVPLNVIIANNADIYDSIIKKKLSDAEWQSVRERFLQIQEITPFIVDSTIIDICLKNLQTDNAIAYFKFLRENNYSLSAAVIGKYLRLYALKTNLSDEEKTEILETYYDLRKKYQFLDAITAEHCIISLCLTDQWEKSFEILEMLKLTNVPGNTTYSVLVAAAFKNKRSDIAWNFLSELMSHNGLMPQNIAYTSYLLYCELEGKEAFNENMAKMFDFWAEYSIMPHNKIISDYIDTGAKYGWSSKATTISKTGRCSHCGRSLAKVTINDDIFRKLVKSMMDDVIIGSDIYYKTNPKELQNFKTFVERTKPYDVVIDGLNITYKDKSSPQMLLDVIKYFTQYNKKVLVLARQHQKKSPIFQNVQKNALVFCVNNLSADDPYLLYATMVSGKNAMFVSTDLMRQHKFRLTNLELRREFKKWQCSHQYFIKKWNTTFYVQKPFVYLPTAQNDGNYWHVPYIADDINITDSHEFPDKWYCIRQQIK